MPTIWPWCGFGVPWGRLRWSLVVAWRGLVWGFRVALGWLWTPESMASICLLYGLGVALDGLQLFLVQGSRFDVRGSTFSLRPEPQTEEIRLPPVCRKPG